MHRLLERFSAVTSTAVVFVYLVGLFAGTSLYFVGHAVGFSPSFAASVGIALACAVELHSWLSQRLTRQLWQQRNKLDASLPEWDSATTQFHVHLGITCGLVAFSVFNSIAFWALETHPATVGDWLAVGLRGLIIPVAFLAAGFLTPLQHDASQLLQDAAHVMLRRTVRITIKQWHKRIAQAHRNGVDLAPVAVELMEDAHEHRAARQIRIIASALDRAERGNMPAVVVTALSAPQKPPTGPGTPARAASGRNGDERPTEAAAGVIRLQPSISRATAARQDRHSRRRAEQLQKVTAWLSEDIKTSRGEIARRLKCSASHAGMLRRKALDDMSLQLVPERLAQ